MSGSGAQPASSNANKILFWGCFMALIATAFGFIIRSMIINDLGIQFDLSETQKGEILGAGLWPFAISIVLFSLIIDKIGYGRAMGFAFVCHVIASVLTIFATGYWSLYAATFVMTLGNGAVEAVINPVVATMFSKEKTKWLNILHAGWPGGLVVGGIITIAVTAMVKPDSWTHLSALVSPESAWKLKVGLVLVPTILYGIILFGKKFPVHERVAAGVTYIDMLKEVGIAGFFIIVSLMTFEVGRVFEFAKFGMLPGTSIPMLNAIIIVVLVGIFGFYVRSFGRPLFIFMLLIMMPLATTELGTDSWITPLMEAEMAKMSLNAGWLLVYTSFIMMVLRFNAGNIVHRINPLGLLAVSATIAACGLTFLSYSSGITILLAATLYGFGKSFFWPTTLGIVAERFPKGGAMAINTIAGVGMLSVGIVGSVFFGYVQDTATGRNLQIHDTQQSTKLYDQYVGAEKVSIFGKYRALDQVKIAAASPEDKKIIDSVTNESRKGALRTVAILPCTMLVCYIILLGYFATQGGYKPVHLDVESAEMAGTGEL